MSSSTPASSRSPEPGAGLLTRLWILLASVPIMAGAAAALLAVRVYKRFGEVASRDPFHDSRRHPLNSPEAPRG